MEPKYNEYLIKNKIKPGNIRKIAYLEWGNYEAYPIVCLHGLTRNAHDFDYLAQVLAKNYRVICPDIIGRGKSDYATDISQYSYKQYVTDLHSLLKHLQITDTHLIGTSMGGIIGMIYATVFRKTIHKLVLNDVGAFISRKALERIGQYVTHYPEFITFAEAATYIKEIFAQFGIDNEKKWQHFITHSIIRNIDGTYRLNYDPVIGTAFQKPAIYKADVNLWSFWNILRKNMPILILRGEFSNVLSVMTTRQMKLTHPHCKEVEIKGVGHAPSLMNDDQISLIDYWLHN